MSSSLRLASSLLLVALLLGAGVWQAVRFQMLAPASRGGGGDDLMYLPSAGQARLMSLGNTTLVADYYWIRSLQYFMDPTQARHGYRNLADLLDLVVSLDPEFEYAYEFAGIAVPVDAGRMRYLNVDRSIALLKKGIARFPDNWQLHFQLGFNYLNYANQPGPAAEELATAAKLPGAPPYLSQLAARVFAVSGDLDRATAFTKEMLGRATDPEYREAMRRRLDELDVERELRRIEAAAEAFRQAEGRYPRGLPELVSRGFPPPPSDYLLDDQGRANRQGGAERMILHEEWKD